MLLLPYERLTITTHLNPDEAQAIIADVVEPCRWVGFFWSGHHKPYQGQVSERRFKITRIIHYRNSFLPVIIGKICPTRDGCEIRITMRPHLLVIGFMVFWLGNAGWMFINTLGDVIFSLFALTPVEPGSPVFSGLFFAFGYALFLGGFKLESLKSRGFFRELFMTLEQGADFRLANRFLGMTAVQWGLLTFLILANSIVVVVFIRLMG